MKYKVQLLQIIHRSLATTSLAYILGLLLYLNTASAQPNIDSLALNEAENRDSTEVKSDSIQNTVHNNNIIKYIGYSNHLVQNITQIKLPGQLAETLTLTDSANVKAKHVYALIQKFSVPVEYSGENIDKRAFMVDSEDGTIVSTAFVMGIPIYQSLIAAKRAQTDTTNGELKHFREIVWDNYEHNIIIHLSLVSKDIHTVKLDTTTYSVQLKHYEKPLKPDKITRFGVKTKFYRGSLLYEQNIELIFNRKPNGIVSSNISRSTLCIRNKKIDEKESSTKTEDLYKFRLYSFN